MVFDCFQMLTEVKWVHFRNKSLKMYLIKKRINSVLFYMGMVTPL